MLVKRVLFLGLVFALTFTNVLAAGAPGFFTAQPAMLAVKDAGATVKPLISVGDILVNDPLDPSDDYRFEAIPDGIGVTTNGDGTLDVFVAHETSLVPFPYTISGSTATGLSDFDNAQVSRLKLSQNNAGVLSGKIVLDSSQNYQRFCSAFIAGPKEGFKRSIFFANEEATDFISPPPLQAWPANPSNQRQAGLVIAMDTKNGKTYELYGMGRFNHENTVVVPGGWTRIVTLSGDDTFSAPASQMYMYTAASDTDLLADKGSLWAFQATAKNGVAVTAGDPFNGANDYGDIASGDTLQGQFIPVPRDIAVGDQTALENWSNANNVFQFIRIEDIATDKNNPRVVYFADTGEPRAIASLTTGRLSRGPSGTFGPYPNGRIFKMVLNAANPTLVDSLQILINGDAGGYGEAGALHNPDNVDTSTNSLMIGEDPGSHNGGPAFTNARIWRYDLSTGAFTVAAEVDQSLTPNSLNGAWESSGILDVSSLYGPGAWLVNVQAHTLFVETEARTVFDPFLNRTNNLTFKREGGQLLLIVIPGS